MGRRYSLIVFDWDGTLIDSAAGITQCIQEAAREMGLEVPTRERASHVIGLGLEDSLRIAVPALRTEQYPQFVSLYRRHFQAREDSMRLFPGIEPLLERISKTHRLAIATGKSRRGLDRGLEATGLRAYFSASRCADETQPKPHPAMLLELMDEFSIKETETLMIGDTSHDMEMARGAGVDAVAVTYGAHAEPALLACGPRGCFGDVGALDQWLSRNA
jgi:phosphoglycolate phosphatase